MKSRLFWLMWMLVWICPAQAETVRRALLFYHDEGAPGTQRLRYSPRDVERMHEVLSEVGGFAPIDITTLSRPTPGQVQVALTTLTRKVEADNRRGNDTWLLVYYAGHADAEAIQLGRQLLPMKTFSQEVAKTGARVRIVILDACASGSLTRTRGGTPAPPFVVRLDSGEVEGEVVFTSSAASEASQESDQIGGGVFTHHLISGLRGAADRSGDGAVSLSESYTYAYDMTLLDTLDSAAGIQHPTYKMDLSGQGDLIFTRPSQADSTLQFPAGTTGRFLVFDASRKVFVAELEFDGESRSLGLPPGRYWVQKRESDHLLVTQLSLARGAVVPVLEDKMSRQSYDDDPLRGVVLANRRTAMADRAEVSFGAYYQSFLTSPELDVQDELIPPAFLFGVTLGLDDWPTPGFTLRTDGAFTITDTSLPTEPYPIRMVFTEVQGGVAVLRTFEWRAFELGVGPRLVALYLHRSFPYPLEQPAQTFASMTPGLVVNTSVDLFRGLTLSAEMRAQYLYYYAGDVDLSLGYLEGGLNLSTHF